MNKLYAFCALVFLTACGSSGIDGSWSDVEDSDIGMEITGDKAKLTDSGDFSVTCPIEGPDQDVYTLVCKDEGLEFFVYLRLDDGILKVVVDDEVRSFVRK
tara:strand:- start:32 stop:334 length:303 start_codon:yes stop_codon:yes gene_type:complete